MKQFRLPVNGPMIIAAVIAACVLAGLMGGGTRQAAPGADPADVSPTVGPPTVPTKPPDTPAGSNLADLTAAEQRDTIARVRTQWRSESGEKVDAILESAAKVAHFYRRGPWDAYRDSDGQPMAGIAFVRSKAAKDDEAVTIYWRFEKDGSIAPGPPSLAAIQFGSKAFIQALIQNELTDEIKAPNTAYLFDPKNLDWLMTEAGPLSILLVRAQCRPNSALFPAYNWSKAERERKPELSEWTFSATISCKRGPVYCADGGPLMFNRNEQGPWKAASTCAKLLVGEEPAAFIKPLIREQVP